jgi:hypothetical protein
MAGCCPIAVSEPVIPEFDRALPHLMLLTVRYARYSVRFTRADFSR